MSNSVAMSVAILLVATALPRSAAADTVKRFTLAWEGKEREYFVHLPDRVLAGAGLPLILALHGGGASGEGMAGSYGFKPVVEAGGAIAVYPSAIAGAWAVGGLPTGRRGLAPDHDDAGFLDAVVDRVKGTYAVDADRLFVTGASRGGFMTQWYLPRSRHRIAAAGSVIAGMTRHIADSLSLDRPVPYMMIVGDRDPFMPIEGAVNRSAPQFNLLSATEAATALATANRVDPAPPTQSDFGNANPRDRCTNRVETWGSTGRTVTLVTVIGGTHSVPGGWICNDFHHAEVMWNFFREQAPSR